jgi:hypothetical protein
MSPKLIVAAYSGGKQSETMLRMILRGDIVRPSVPFIVLNADPGMENSNSSSFVAAMKRDCEMAKIPFLQVKRNLFKELLELKTSGKKRFDTPPFWTKNRETGKIGRLMQSCTQAYKIVPMDQMMRKWMSQNLGIPVNRKRIGNNIVCKYIGFSFDESDRIKQQDRKYIYHEYPLVDAGMTGDDCTQYLQEAGLPVPPRSVCNACFANDFNYLKEMFLNRPNDWAQAILVDDAIRDLTCIGIRDECYVFSGCVSLRQLAEKQFNLDFNIVQEAAVRCHSGHCFV